MDGFLCEQLYRNTLLGEQSQQTVQTTSVASVVFIAYIWRTLVQQSRKTESTNIF